MAMNQTQQFERMAARQGHRPAIKLPETLLPNLEAVIGIAIVVAIGMIFPNLGWGMLNVNPHPLWIVVVAIAARYGRQPGYFAGVLAAVAYSAFIATRGGVQAMFLDPGMLVQPLLMVVGGAALGELTDARERRLAGLEARTRNMEGALAKLLDRCRSLNLVKDALERRIVFGERTVRAQRVNPQTINETQQPERSRETSVSWR